MLKKKIPGAIGFVDGTHVEIPVRRLHREAYINRKKYPSVVLQVIIIIHKRSAINLETQN